MKEDTIFINRELSWLDFNRRVLVLGKDKNVPLAEQVKFLAIYGSNLDEFFMVRVASLKDMVNAGYTKPDLSGMKPSEQLEKIGEKTHRLVEMQYSPYNRSLIPALKANGLRVISHHEELTEEEKEQLHIKSLPTNLYDAVCAMERDAFIREILGEHISNVYIGSKKDEWDRYCKTVTEWEVDTYLDKF